MCRGGGGGIFSICCLISNTLPQLEQSSLHPTTVLRHRLRLQTTCYSHLRLLLHLHISSKGKQKQQQARSLRPFNPPPPLSRSPGTSLQNGEEVLQSKCWSAMKALLIATSTLFTELKIHPVVQLGCFQFPKLCALWVKVAKICHNCS